MDVLLTHRSVTRVRTQALWTPLRYFDFHYAFFAHKHITTLKKMLPQALLGSCGNKKSNLSPLHVSVLLVAPKNISIFLKYSFKLSRELKNIPPAGSILVPSGGKSIFIIW